MSRHVIYLSLISIAIAGCSSNNKKQAIGDFDYANQQESKAIVIPGDLDKPQKDSEYNIPSNINNNGPIGVKVDVRAPSLVLPVAASSRVEPKSDKAEIWFDQVLDDTELQLFIYQAIQDQLAEDGVALLKQDAKNKIFESDWYHKETEAGWIFTHIESTESMRFQYQITTKPHGRSVSLAVNLAEYMFTDQNGSTKTLGPIDKHRAEIAMLNKIVSQVDYKYRLKSRENRILRANQKLVSISDDKASLIVEMNKDDLWSNLPLFFEDNGFTISDLNETKQIYFVDFVKPEVSWWDSLWGDDKPVLNLADGKYQFKLVERGEGSELTILDEQGNALDRSLLVDNFALLEAALSFRNTF